MNHFRSRPSSRHGPKPLVNGSSGIAVVWHEYAAPHLREVCEAICRTIDDPGISTEELMRIMPGPDFPTGGVIMGIGGVRDAYLTGRGRCVSGDREIERRDGLRRSL